MRSPRGVLLLFVLGVILPAGCSSHRQEPKRIEPVTVEVQGSPAVRVVGAHVHPLNGHAEIHGWVRQRVWRGSVLAGHVDIEVQRPDGQVYRRVDVPLQAGMGPLSKSRDAEFRMEVPGGVPEGSILRVQYHSGRHT